MFSPEINQRAEAVITAYGERGLKLALAESCTGGLISAALINVPGASKVVDRGLVTYANAAKMDLLGVPAETLEGVGAVSEETARAMARGALNYAGIDAAVAVTGIAGPDGGTAEKPVGLVHIAAVAANRTARHREYRFGDIGRDEIRLASVVAALDMLLDLVAD
jgi:nicotinamide-nucleotide amidase